MWLALKLIASGAFEAVLKALSAAFKWCSRDWTRFPFVMFFIAFNLLVWIKVPAIEAERDENLQLALAERNAHAATVENYRQAALQARREAEANAARVEAEQVAITEETIDDYETRLAAVRAHADRLRSRLAAPVDPGRADAVDLSRSGAAAGPAAPAAGDPEFPSARDLCPRGRICLTLAQALTASEDAIRCDALIDWTLRQSRLRFTPVEQPDGARP